MKTLILTIGGIQGQGIVSAGSILSKAFSRSGYYTYTHRTFASRIKGGHTRSKIEISPFRNAAAGKSVNLIVAFDKKTAEMNFDISPDACLMLADEKLSALSKDFGENTENFLLPFSQASEKVGSKLAKTSVALGFLCRLLGMDKDIFQDLLSEKYKKKGPLVLKANLQAFNAGLDMAKKPCFEKYDNLKLDPVPMAKRPVMTGNYALALGALSGGCRFISAYPITPASEIMEYMSAKLPAMGGVMIQTEDEIAAATMAIGASYGGVRSMTSTSGPGLSLMMEGIGLAAMAEIPLVVIDCQRVGPSTGLPTRVEQSDFNTALYGGHGEYPSITLAPYSVETCFSLSKEAFQVADEFSCPVFVMSDLALGLFPQTVDPFEIGPKAGPETASLSEKLGQEEFFNRYQGDCKVRPAPGTPGGIHYTTGLEHGPLGAPENSPENRISMMKRRMEKFDSLAGLPGIALDKSSGQLLVIATGSAYGICQKALKDLGGNVVLGALHRLKPFPEDQFSALEKAFDSILVVEYNYGGQLFQLLRKHMPAERLCNLHSLRKFSGQAFTLAEIENKAKELI